MENMSHELLNNEPMSEKDIPGLQQYCNNTTDQLDKLSVFKHNRCNGPPPPKPTGPKPRTAVRRKSARRAITTSVPNVNYTWSRVRTPSLRRRSDEQQFGERMIKRMECTIKRRHTELCKEKPLLSFNAVSGNMDVVLPSKRMKLASSILNKSSTQSNLSPFRRNSSFRRPTYKRFPRQVLAKGTRDLSRTQSLLEAPRTSVAVSGSSDTAKLQKIRRPPSFCIKRFVAKKMRMLFEK